MLKNRQEGIINLHGLWSAAAVLFLFLIHKYLFILTGKDFPQEHFNIYMLGVAIAAFANVRLLRTYSEEFLSMGWYKTFQLTYRQVLRIMIVELAIVFALKDFDIGRLYLGSFLASSGILLFAMNKSMPKRLCQLSFKTQVIPTLIVGSTESLSSLQEWITNKASYGIDIVGYASESDANPDAKQPIPYLGNIRDLDEKIEELRISQVVIIQNAISKAATIKVMEIAQKSGCRLRVYNNWQEEYQQRVVVEHEGNHTFLTYEDEPLENPINRMAKRTFDVAMALPIVAFVLPPLTLAVWFFQRKQSEGPIFYAQPRTGMTKRTFHIIKYRTMHVSDENVKNVAKQATKGDSRIYPFGAFLRKTSLDELPQFLNVLLGEMSVAGPRPHLIDHDREFSNQLKVYYTRHFVKPGITGLAQSMGFRGEIIKPEHLKKRIAYDIKYINTWSLMLDLKIMLVTAKTVLFPPKSAY